MDGLRQLRFDDERVHIDGAFLGEVVVQLGPEAAEALILDALGGLAVELEGIAARRARIAAGAAPEAGLADLVEGCDRLSRTAWEMGLTTLAGTAIDLGLCAERGDRAAMAAVGARLERVGRLTLSQAMDDAACG